jgi:hypothetical protein
MRNRRCNDNIAAVIVGKINNAACGSGTDLRCNRCQPDGVQLQ